MRFLLSFYLLGLMTLYAEINWAADYEEAFAKAKAETKGVMILLSQENCKACWYMENIVFDDDVVVQEVEKSFIPLILDIHDDTHGLQFSGTPTLYFLTNTNETIRRVDGVLNIKEMTGELRKIEGEKKEASGR